MRTAVYGVGTNIDISIICQSLLLFSTCHVQARPCHEEGAAYLKGQKKATASCHRPNRVYTK